MHVLPNGKIPFARLPLDIFVANRRSFIKQELIGKDSPSKKEEKAQTVGSKPMTLEEFEFPHAVQVFEAGLSYPTLELSYKKCAEFLEL